MFEKPKAQVLVVGAGPAGLFCAMVLENHGIKVDIIDTAWRASQRDTALALHARTIEALDDVGMAAYQLLDSGQSLDKIALYERGERRKEIDLHALPSEMRTPSTDFPRLLAVSQSTLEEAFASHLEQRFRRKVMWNHRLVRLEQEQDAVAVEIDRLSKESTGAIIARTEWVVEKTLHGKYEFVIGADGYDSIVRDSLGVSWNPFAPPEVFSYFACEAVSHHDSTLRVLFDGAHGGVLWPMPADRWLLALQVPDYRSEEHEDKSRLSFELDLERARAELDIMLLRRAPWAAQWVGDLVWSATTRFERRLADSFGSGRCWLVGDAAHVATPIDIQIEDFGLFEARSLATQIARVLQGVIPMRALRDYDQDEETRWQRTTAPENRFKIGAEAAFWE